MGVNLYASVAEFKDRLAITGTEQDFAIDRVLAAASRHIDKITGTRFYVNTTPEVRYYTADRYFWEVEIDNALTVTELATDNNNDSTYETVWTAGTDWHLEPLNAPLDGEPYTKIVKSWWTGRFSLPAWPNSVRVTGTFGYCALANVPPNIREATMVLAEATLHSGDLSMPGVSSYKIGNELAVTMSQQRQTTSSSIRSLIDPYCRRAYMF